MAPALQLLRANTKSAAPFKGGAGALLPADETALSNGEADILGFIAQTSVYALMSGIETKVMA